MAFASGDGADWAGICPRMKKLLLVCLLSKQKRPEFVAAGVGDEVTSLKTKTLVPYFQENISRDVTVEISQPPGGWCFRMKVAGAGVSRRSEAKADGTMEIAMVRLRPSGTPASFDSSPATGVAG